MYVCVYVSHNILGENIYKYGLKYFGIPSFHLKRRKLCNKIKTIFQIIFTVTGA